MKSLNILLVTRNRTDALIDALFSVKRISLLAGRSINIEVTIQDNSDCAVSSFLLHYFSKYFILRYHKSSRLLSMAENWNEGLIHVIEQNPNYIVVLADRRLASLNLINAIYYMEETQQPFICFDHQDVWINAKKILIRNHSYKLNTLSNYALLAAIGSGQIDWHYPMLFNCVLTNKFMLKIFDRYGSFAGGTNPDTNFLARIADIGIENFFIYDAPCIITNARFVVKSTGGSALKNGTIRDIEHTNLSGIESFPTYMENFFTANIAGSLARYWCVSRMRSLIDVPKFFKSSLIELSYPKSIRAFLEMKNSLREFSEDFNLTEDLKHLIDFVAHAPSSNQLYPIDSNSDLSNSPNLQLLAQVEHPKCGKSNVF